MAAAKRRIGNARDDELRLVEIGRRLRRAWLLAAECGCDQNARDAQVPHKRIVLQLVERLLRLRVAGMLLEQDPSSTARAFSRSPSRRIRAPDSSTTDRTRARRGYIPRTARRHHLCGAFADRGLPRLFIASG